MTAKKPILTMPEAPEQADRQVILRGLGEFEAKAAGPLAYKPLVFLLKDEAGATIGGLWGMTIFRWAIVELLFVPESLRGMGLGREMMDKAEAIARERDCIGMWLDTYSFQAPGFYEKLGFTPFGKLDDMPLGHHRLFMQKRLDR